jgi:predicted O-methyltransferase YrrM
MPSEKDFTNGINPLCPNDELWTSRDEQSSEDEVAEFLHGLVRLIKPALIVETGCYLGDATLAMARALQKNNYGILKSCDIDTERVAQVNARIGQEGLNHIAGIYLMSGIELISNMGRKTDFAFIDSSPIGKDRAKEIEELLIHCRKGTIFALHDTAPQHVQISAMSKLVPCPQIYFNCPRGLSLYQKT